MSLRRIVSALAAVAGTAMAPCMTCAAQSTPTVDRVLHSGWRIRPAGRHLALGDMLLGGAISPDGGRLAIVNAGYNAHALHIIDLRSEKVLASVPVPIAWNGIAWGPDGRTIYVAGGVNNPAADVHRVREEAEGTWRRDEGFKLTGTGKAMRCIAGLAISPDGAVLYVLNQADGKVRALATADGRTLWTAECGANPYACCLARSGETLYVANWGGAQVVALSVSASGGRVLRTITTPPHPNDLALASDGRLFVSCGSADLIAVYDSATGREWERIATRMDMKGPLGSTPVALALAPDGSRLYAANSDNNSICVVDTVRPGHSRVLGAVPTGWFPSAVIVCPDGKRIIACSGKGTGTRPNPARKPISQRGPAGFEYIARQLGGMASFIDVGNSAALAAQTQTVRENSPYRSGAPVRGSGGGQTAVPLRVGARSPIQHVLYIIKENRTYDQVYGDLKQGNGDAQLCLFGRDVTPNQHALAEEFVLLDNLYCSGEVSEDGHPWSTSAAVTDYTQRAWVLAYSGKGHPAGGGQLEDPAAGFIWEACARKGLTYRTYGEYAGHPSLADHSSAAFIGKAGPGSAPPGRDTDRADVFIQEFKEFEKTGTVPRFMVMSLGENHTNGTRPGSHSPKAMVASNDLAVGRIVEAISQSSLWSKFAIFVIEDDAQNGPDHVDSHRTAGLVISPWTRRRAVDSTHYTTCSMLRTMELILGLPPLTQHDAGATAMFGCFAAKPSTAPFHALPASYDLQERNVASAYGAQQSASMDWSAFDRIDEDLLNRILWHSIKGASVGYPTPIRRMVAGAADGAISGRGVGRGEDDGD